MGNFQGIQLLKFSWIGYNYYIIAINFTDTHTHAIMQAYFMGLIFTVSQLSIKTVKIGSLKLFLLHSNKIYNNSWLS